MTRETRGLGRADLEGLYPALARIARVEIAALGFLKQFFRETGRHVLGGVFVRVVRVAACCSCWSV